MVVVCTVAPFLLAMHISVIVHTGFVVAVQTNTTAQLMDNHVNQDTRWLVEHH